MVRAAEIRIFAGIKELNRLGSLTQSDAATVKIRLIIWVIHLFHVGIAGSRSMIHSDSLIILVFPNHLVTNLDRQLPWIIGLIAEL